MATTMPNSCWASRITYGKARASARTFAPLALSVRAGQLEDQAEPDSELRPALGARHSSHRHQRTRRDLPARTKLHRVPLRNGPAIPIAASQTARTRLVVPGDKGVPAGMTHLLQSFRPAHWNGLESRATSGKTSIRAGWGLFYNPIEELVLAQFGAEPPFGGSSSLSDVFFNTRLWTGWHHNTQSFRWHHHAPPRQAGRFILFRPILLYGEFQPHLRSQYTTQYNLTIQQELSESMMFQIGYVGSQGHRLLASHDINPPTRRPVWTCQHLPDCAPTWR